MVQGTLPTRSAGEGESQLPEVAEVLRIERSEAQATKTTEKTVCTLIICCTYRGKSVCVIYTLHKCIHACSGLAGLPLHYLQYKRCYCQV
jgi:hypothetical protein